MTTTPETTVTYKYEDVFGLEPPPFYEQKELSDKEFSQFIHVGPNTAVLSHKWDLTPVDNGPAMEDPLIKLNRMGLVDLINHDENQPVTLVFSTQKNKKSVDRTKKYGREMKRANGDKVWLVENARVKRIDKEDVQVPKLLARIHVTVQNDTYFMVKLDNIRCISHGNRHKKKIEIWKPMPEKLKQVYDLIAGSLDRMKRKDWRYDAPKRNSIVSFLLGESKGDRMLTLAIINAYTRLKYFILEKQMNKIKHLEAKRAKMDQIQDPPEEEHQPKKARIQENDEDDADEG